MYWQSSFFVKSIVVPECQLGIVCLLIWLHPTHVYIWFSVENLWFWDYGVIFERTNLSAQALIRFKPWNLRYWQVRSVSCMNIRLSILSFPGHLGESLRWKQIGTLRGWDFDLDGWTPWRNRAIPAFPLRRQPRLREIRIMDIELLNFGFEYWGDGLKRVLRLFSLLPPLKKIIFSTALAGWAMFIKHREGLCSDKGNFHNKINLLIQLDGSIN